MCTDPSLPIFLIEHTPNFVFGVYKNADPDMHDCCIFFIIYSTIKQRWKRVNRVFKIAV